MLMINGTDYTLYLLVPLALAVLFGIQYVLCGITDSQPMRALPFAVPALMLFSAVNILTAPVNGSFLDLRSGVAAMIALFAAACVVVLVLARVVYKRRNRK
ncbi:MAG: hypothetical protein IJ347_07185 [Faecalibacterium sp.]|nr:hypothetical protein [Faecalibacterium sp.]